MDWMDRIFVRLHRLRAEGHNAGRKRFARADGDFDRSARRVESVDDTAFRSGPRIPASFMRSVSALRSTLCRAGHQPRAEDAEVADDRVVGMLGRRGRAPLPIALLDPRVFRIDQGLVVRSECED